MEACPEILQLKVRLIGISPMIWRRVAVLSSTTLRELHGILQVAMGWAGIHLFLFDIHAVQYGTFELHAADPDVPLQRFAFRKHDRFGYIYDMGDCWVHDIRVEALGGRQPRTLYPNCTGGSGTCPAEDCGGVHGYLACREEAEGHEAWMDIGVMMELLEDVAATSDPNRSVRDFMSDDVEAAMARMVARKPYLHGQFSRCTVNQAYRAGRHRALMRQRSI